MNKNIYKGFSLTEVMLVLLVSSVILLASLPVITVKKKETSGIYQNAVSCISSYAGNITLPVSDITVNVPDDACRSAINSCKIGSDNSCNTLISYSNNRDYTLRSNAKKILRAACDIGAKEACNYFVTNCSVSALDCDNSRDEYDIHYYLTLPADNSNPGKQIILDKVNEYYLYNLTNLVDEVDNACSSSNGETACRYIAQNCLNQSDKTTHCQKLINACGTAANACKVGYLQDINRSCKQINENAGITTNGTQFISTDEIGNKFGTYCDMTTDGGGWTLVFVAKGAQINDTLISTYAPTINRTDISSTNWGTTRTMQTKLIQNWPYYTQMYWERWLPDSLTGRSYAMSGWSKRAPFSVSNSPTNMNLWSTTRSNNQGWILNPVTYAQCYKDSDNSFAGAFQGTTCPDGTHFFSSCPSYNYYYYYPNGIVELHTTIACSGTHNYLWFQNTSAWNGFFPNDTYGYWRISNSNDVAIQWTQYDALTNGMAMPGYGLYVR